MGSTASLVGTPVLTAVSRPARGATASSRPKVLRNHNRSSLLRISKPASRTPPRTQSLSRYHGFDSSRAPLQYHPPLPLSARRIPLPRNRGLFFSRRERWDLERVDLLLKRLGVRPSARRTVTNVFFPLSRNTRTKMGTWSLVTSTPRVRLSVEYAAAALGSRLARRKPGRTAQLLFTWKTTW